MKTSFLVILFISSMNLAVLCSQKLLENLMITLIVVYIYGGSTTKHMRSSIIGLALALSLIVGGAGLGLGYYCLTIGVQGPQGAPGLPGEDGTDGVNGTDGIDGVNGTDGTDGTNSVLQVAQVSSVSGYTYSTTLTWATITGMQIILTPEQNGSRLYISYTMTVQVTGNYANLIRITIDGLEVFIAQIYHVEDGGLGAITYPLSISFLSGPLNDTAHTIQAQWYTPSSITAVNNYHRVLTIMEIAAA
jgi:hypothetical protein